MTDDSPALQEYNEAQTEMTKMFPGEFLYFMAKKVDRVVLEYRGSGDSADEEDFEFLTVNGNEVEVDLETSDKIRNFFWAMIDRRHGGWENNDGGRGRIMWKVPTGEVLHEHSDFVTESVDSEHEGIDDMVPDE
jgi:hypothetical protein